MYRDSVTALRFRLAFALTGGLCGCAGSAAPVDASVTVDDASSAVIELGTGQSAWQDLPAGSVTAVELIHGPQGGYHFFARVRFSGIEPPVLVSFRVTALDNASVLNDPEDRIRLRPGLGLNPHGTGWESSNAQLVILTAITSPSQVVGRRCRLEVRVETLDDPQGVTLARDVIVVDNT